MASKFIHVVPCVEIPVFIRLNSISLEGYHTLFNRSSVSGHLGCFYVLAFAHYAAMNISPQDFALSHILG